MNARLWTGEEIQRVLALYRDGYRCAEIASMLSRTELAVRLKLLSMGLSSRRILAAATDPGTPEMLVPVEEETLAEETATRLRAERELELREQRAEDRKLVEKAKTEILEERIAADFRQHLCNLPRLERMGPPRTAPSGAEPVMTPVLVISDVHAGQTVDSREVEGLGYYNPAITLARLILLQNEVCRILSGRRIDKLVVLFGGDILHGHLGHSLEDDLTIPIAQQADFALHIFFHFVTALAQVVPEIEIHGVAGNHGRWPGMRKMPSDRRWSNLDTVFYHALSALCEHGGLENVRVDERISSRRIIEIGRHRLELLHGDEVRGGAFCTGGMSREVSNTTLRQVQAGRPHVDLWVMGDKHFAASVPYGTGAFIVNGSFVGVDAFGMNFLPSPPSQTLFFLHPELGKVESHEIRLRRAEVTIESPYPLKPSLIQLIERYKTQHPIRI